MGSSVVALTVAVVGVVGTLLSGVLAHRSALRAKSLELDHAQREREAERAAAEHRETVQERRAAYTAFNHRLRQFHYTVSKHLGVLRAGPAPAGQTEEREAARQALREAYAEAQMVVPDDVLLASSSVVQQLYRVHYLLGEHEGQVSAPDTESGSASASASLDDIQARIEHASEGLYAVRQTMRRDLGITELAIPRPDNHRIN
ncbi:hypothetical protein [Streptomyces sp. NPDC058045]|uniref:hypothetical protein n=1 Tax=Streptomyces sp. NPDC058045 TaxID=3346311 RepID=UPI0036DFCA83